MSKSFTLIELLIVLGLIAVLAAILITVLKPTQLFQNARDSQRIGDLNNLQKVFDIIYVDTQGTFNELSFASPNTVYLSLKDSSSNCGSYLSELPSLPSGWSYRCSANPQNIDGTGWIPLNFKQFPLIQLSKLPLDPLNQPPYYYSYVAGGSYEITAKLENIQKGDKNHKSAQDGGDHPLVYEVGTNKKLTPLEVQGRGATYDQLTYSDPSLVGYWPFDEGSGNIAYDLSGYGNNGTLYNGPQWVDGKVGKALSFDGVNDYVNIPYNPSLDTPLQLTVIAWIFDDNCLQGHSINRDTGPRIWIIRAESCFSGNWHIWNSLGQLKQLVPENSWVSTRWFLFGGTAEVVENSIYMKYYFNGNKIGETNFSGTAIQTGSVPLRMGWEGSGVFKKQLLDEVRIYNRALSDDEIKALYEATK